MTRIAFLLWPDTFEDWYAPLGISRDDYLTSYDGEGMIMLAGTLVRAGIDVHLVHGTLAEAQSAVQIPSGATAHFVLATRSYRALRRLVWGHRWWAYMQPLFRASPVVSTLSPQLIRHLRQLRPDVVVVQDYETPRYDVAAPLLRLAGLRVVAMDTGASARPSRAPWKFWTRELSAELLAVHEVEAQRLRALGHRRVGVWPVPVRTDILVPQDRMAARAELGLDPQARLVFAAARLHPVKDLSLLADACLAVNATLVIAGEGPERQRLERSPCVRLLGWQSAERLVLWYAAADVAALSSRTEGQPIAVLEAFACGRAVVATAVGGVAEIVRNGHTGWLVPPGDLRALATAIDEALTDRNISDGYGQAGRALMLSRHSAAAVAATFSHL